MSRSARRTFARSLGAERSWRDTRRPRRRWSPAPVGGSVRRSWRRLAGLGVSVAVCDIDDATAAPRPATSLADPERRRAGRRLGPCRRGGRGRRRSSEELGPIDILVNNVGIDVIEPFMDSTEDTWDRLLEVNLKGQIACCHAVLDAHMIPNARGRIVNLGSDAGASARPAKPSTPPPRAASSRSRRRWRVRWRGHGITVNCVCPGPTNTALLAQTRRRLARRASAPRSRRPIPLAPRRPARRHRRRRRLPRHRRRRVHDRSDRVGQRRPHDG